MREIAEDPHGYILRQGWATLDFSDAAELAQLRQLHETLQLEIIAVLEALNHLRESPDYELCQLSEKKPGLLDELAAERKQLLEKEAESCNIKRTSSRKKSKNWAERRALALRGSRRCQGMNGKGMKLQKLEHFQNCRSRRR